MTPMLQVFEELDLIINGEQNVNKSQRDRLEEILIEAGNAIDEALIILQGIAQEEEVVESPRRSLAQQFAIDRYEPGSWENEFARLSAEKGFRIKQYDTDHAGSTGLGTAPGVGCLEQLLTLAKTRGMEEYGKILDLAGVIGYVDKAHRKRHYLTGPRLAKVVKAYDAAKIGADE